MENMAEKYTRREKATLRSNSRSADQLIVFCVIPLACFSSGNAAVSADTARAILSFDELTIYCLVLAKRADMHKGKLPDVLRLRVRGLLLCQIRKVSQGGFVARAQHSRPPKQRIGCFSANENSRDPHCGAQPLSRPQPYW